MLVSWKWLSRHVDTAGVDPLRFAERFTLCVAEIDDVVQWGFGLGDVVVADVLTVEPHPNADKLRLATVDVGGRTVRVVCGAPDLRVGMRVPFVPPGVTLPSGITVRDGEVRGVASPGMLASEADLGLSDFHDGLMALDGVSAPAGTKLPQALELEDVLYDVDNKAITHRPDLWGQYGVAREVAALLAKPLLPLQVDDRPGQGDAVALSVQAQSGCTHYVCARMGGVAALPSPVDVRLFLRRLGVRPIDQLVDATNLVMLETGNPLHAFDARSVRGNTIAVRKAHAGETLETLDGQLRELQPSDCVICDGAGPVAVAGVMGGGNSEVRADTTEIVLEAAHFDAPSVRRTSMRLGLRTEASARYEKALDPTLPRTAARRFLHHLATWQPGLTLLSAFQSAGEFATENPPTLRIRTTASYLRERLGVDATELPDAWMDTCLTRLAFGVERTGDALVVTVPGFRATKDVKIPEDLVEELGRHYGYGNVKSVAPQVAARPPFTPPLKLLERRVRTFLVNAGLTEQVLYGFDDEDVRRRLGLAEPAGTTRVAVKNPIASGHTHMRRSLLPNLLRVAENGLVQGDDRLPGKKGMSVQVFELGRAFVPDAPGPRDPGLPRVLTHGTPDEIAVYLGRMDADMRESVEQAQHGTQPLPLQPVRLAFVVAERLGGAAEGSKLVFPPADVTTRILRQAAELLDDLTRALLLPSLRFVAPGTLSARADGAPDASPSWRSDVGFDVATADGTVVGFVSALHPRVRIALDVPAHAAVCEIALESVLP